MLCHVKIEAKEQIWIQTIKQINDEMPVLNYPLIQFLSGEVVLNYFLTKKLLNFFGLYSLLL